jgi:hypothetical protein
MRKFVIVMAAAAGLGLMASSGASAAPVGAFAIDAAANAMGAVEEVGYRGCCRPHRKKVRWHCPRCYRYVCRKVYR